MFHDLFRLQTASIVIFLSKKYAYLFEITIAKKTLCFVRQFDFAPSQYIKVTVGNIFLQLTFAPEFNKTYFHDCI